MKIVRTLLVLVALAAACSSGHQDAAGSSSEASPPTTAAPPTTVAPARPTADVDQLVAVGDTGARMHLTCSGSGDATVVIASGFGDAGDSWSAVTPAVSRQARVCTYARFGLGTSDAPPTRQTFSSEANDLHALLEAAGEPGPYVVVGHSFGGPEAVTFAARFADEVEGVLLLDASPTGWPAAACAVPDDGSDTALEFRAVCQSYRPNQNPERLDTMRAFDEVSSVDSLGALPLIVMTRADIEYPELAAASQRALETTWNDGQAHWASLSTASEQVAVEDTSHYIQIDQPATVIDHLLTLIG